MNDIVQRLRNFADSVCTDGAGRLALAEAQDAMTEAAGEIERLRAGGKNFQELCDDTIPPFLRAAVTEQWDEERIAAKTQQLAGLLGTFFKPPPAAEDLAKIKEEAKRIFDVLSAKDPATLTEQERKELELATFAMERLNGPRQTP